MDDLFSTRHAKLIIAYLLTGWALNKIYLNDVLDGRIIMLTLSADIIIIMLMFCMIFDTPNFLASMGLALLGNACALTLIGMTMIWGFQFFNPFFLLIFIFTHFCLVTSLQIIHMDMTLLCNLSDNVEIFYPVQASS